MSNDFATYVPAAEEDVEDFNNGTGGGPGQDMKLDFSRGYSTSRWNNYILRQIYDLIVTSRKEQGGWGLPDVSEDYLKGELRGHLKRAQESWALVQPRFLPHSNEMETPVKVTERVEAYHRQRMATVGGRSLRKRVSE